MYGLVCDLKHIAVEVCQCLGNGANQTAVKLLIETAGAETGKGTIKDNTIEAGMGITQFDWIGFKDVLDRTREKDRDKILEYFDIDIDWIKWEDLRYNPLLAMIFTRLKYKLIPEAIPNALEARAKYWKKYYNTEAGKGTPEHYLKMNS